MLCTTNIQLKKLLIGASPTAMIQAHCQLEVGRSALSGSAGLGQDSASLLAIGLPLCSSWWAVARGCISLKALIM